MDADSGDWRVKPVEWLTQKMSPIAEHARANLSKGKGEDPAAGRQGGDVICLHDGNFRE